MSNNFRKQITQNVTNKFKQLNITTFYTVQKKLDKGTIIMTVVKVGTFTSKWNLNSGLMINRLQFTHSEQRNYYANSLRLISQGVTFY